MPTSRAALYPLPIAVRADLFKQLAVIEDAGLPFDKTCSMLQLPQGAQSRLISLQKGLRLGLGVADAGFESGLFTPLEASLLRVACNAGSPSRAYHRLASHYEQQAAAWPR